MKRKLCILLVVWCLLIVALYIPKKRYSAFENRYLETFEWPELKEVISLDWMDDLEAALCDQFNFINASITVKTYIDRLLGRQDNGRVCSPPGLQPSLDQRQTQACCCSQAEK